MKPILPVLKGHPDKAQQHDYFYWEFHENGGRQAVRWGKWKGVRLEKDAQETIDVATQHPDIVEHLKAIMAMAHQSNTDWPLLASELNGKAPPK